MEQFHEEQTLGKAYDARLMRRLLRYAKPYWAIIGLTIILLLVISVTDLARPYLVKIAIDDHIMGANKPYVVVDDTFEHPSIVTIQGLRLLRADRLDAGGEGGGARFKLSKENGQHILRSTEDHGGFVLSSEEVRELRAWDTEKIIRLGGLLFIILSIGFVLNYAQVYLLSLTGQRIIYDIRQELYTHMQSLALAFFLTATRWGGAW